MRCSHDGLMLSPIRGSINVTSMVPYSWPATRSAPADLCHMHCTLLNPHPTFFEWRKMYLGYTRFDDNVSSFIMHPDLNVRSGMCRDSVRISWADERAGPVYLADLRPHLAEHRSSKPVRCPPSSTRSQYYSVHFCYVEPRMLGHVNVEPIKNIFRHVFKHEPDGQGFAAHQLLVL